jgi:O-antigen/teichoic acid export membrane protein
MSTGAPSTRLLARNVGVNLAAQLLPLLVALVLTPYLVTRLGTERFGAFALAMVLIGYLGVFDLGFGRALTKLAAERLGGTGADEIPRLAGTALAVQVVLGTIVGLALTALADPLVDRVATLPPGLRDEARRSLWMVAVCVPIAMHGSAFQGLLEAYQRFDLTGAMRIFLGTGLIAGPVIAAAAGGGLPAVTAALCVVRAVSWIAYAVLCARIVPGLFAAAWRPSWPAVRALVTFGGWLSVANVAGPLIVHADRFILGSVASMRAVAYFATPYDAVTKLWFLPDALLGVLFPAFSASLATRPAEALTLFRRGVTFLFLALFPVTLAIVVLAPDLLRLWLGEEFAIASTRPLRLLALGVFVNGLARVSFVFLQSAGRPDVIAKVTVIELLVYPFVSWAFVRRAGVDGAAAAWLLRIAVDSLIWFALVARAQPALAGPIGRLIAQIVLASAVALGAALIGRDPASRVGLVLVLGIAFVGAGWRWALSPAERAWVSARWRRLPGQDRTVY